MVGQGRGHRVRVSEYHDQGRIRVRYGKVRSIPGQFKTRQGSSGQVRSGQFQSVRVRSTNNGAQLHHTESMSSVHSHFCVFYPAQVAVALVSQTTAHSLSVRSTARSQPLLSLLSRPGGGGTGQSDRSAFAFGEEHSSITATSITSIPPRWRWHWSVRLQRMRFR